jgi:predicted ferric reductase
MTTPTLIRARNLALGLPSERRRRRDHAWDVGVLVAANAVVVALMWWRHGGLHAASTPGGAWTAVGQLTGLYGMLAVLVELGLMARIPWLERHLGFDRLAIWHRWTGFAVVDLLVLHAATITVGYAQAAQQSVVSQTVDFVQHYADVLMAIVSLGLLVVVAVSSVRRARRRLVRESWYSIHLYVYLALALSFAHQLSVGTDFVDDPVARWWWGALVAATVGAVVWFRLLTPLAFNLRHRFHIAQVVTEAPGVVSLYVTGRAMGSVQADAGQFFMLRLFTADGWYRSNPISLSAPLQDGYLRFTIKSLGDHTARMQQVMPGTAIALEGPLGTFTARQRSRPRVVLVAGGIGITPLRALLDDLCGAASEITLLYRVARREEILFGDELRHFVQLGVEVRVIVDDRIGDDRTDRLGIPALRQLVPDLATREVYLCGPPGFVDAVIGRLRRIGVPPARIHYERFDY